MNDLAAILDPIVAGVHILPPATVSWFGVRIAVLPRAQARKLPPHAVRTYLHDAVQSLLYRQVFLPGRVIERVCDPEPRLAPDPSLAERLSAANEGTGFWDGTWTLAGRDGPRCLVARERVRFAIGRHLCRFERAEPEVSAKVAVRMPKELRRASPGFYLALGDHGPAVDRQPLVRFYWNIAPERGPLLVRHVTRQLNAAGCPFRFKVVDHEPSPPRCDAGVLYVPSDAADRFFGTIDDIYESVQPSLGQDTPSFTRALAPGLAVARDPGTGDSFGAHRCGLVAEGPIRSWEGGDDTPARRIAAVAHCFEQAGVDLNRPHGAGIDALRLRGGLRARTPTRDRVPDPASPTDCLDGAARIGTALCAAAIRHGNQWTWLTPVGETPAARTVVRTMAGDLYQGTAGVAWFLAAQAKISGDMDMRDAAAAAIRHALDRVTPDGAPGLYDGGLGIILAAERVAATLNEPWLSRRAHEAFEQLDLDVVGARGGFDLVSGLSGAIIALLILRRVWKIDALLVKAEVLGDALLQRALRSNDGVSWTCDAVVGAPALTGLAHGAAGAGVALAELLRATGAARFGNAARGAFAFERSLFDPAAGGWPDLRPDRAVAHNTEPTRFPAWWCHGAGGIALSRLRAAAILDDPLMEREARTALDGVARSLRQSLQTTGGSRGLCHGLCGKAAALIEGGRLAADDDPLPRQAASVALGWLDAADELAPGLFTGWAGIGVFLLEAAGSGPISPLLLGPDRL